MNWCSEKEIDWDSLSAQVRGWLRAKGSTTARFRALPTQSFRVHLISQTWGAAHQDERELLGLSADDPTQIRTTLLYLGDTAVMFARCVFPASALQGELERLKTLGEGSLGDILFSIPSLERGAFNYAEVASGDQCYAKVHALMPDTLPETLWARRSIFSVGDKKLLVTELLLPALYDSVRQQKS